MKGIKRFSLMMAAVFTLGGLSMANANETREGRKGMDPKVRAEEMTERMVKEYNLTDAQKQQLLDVNQAMAEKMSTHPARPHQGKKEGNRDQARADRDGRRNRADAPKLSAEEREKLHQEMKKVRDDYNAQLQKIMTSEQYQAYAQKQTERAEKRTERGEKMKQNRGKKSGSDKGGRQA
ncbi:MAG: DUF4890 domain-containing protein [Tannerellaceae bacterium]|nr:DUF4890 domain-containing protein [Tannerellaceae bacterium]